MSRDGELPAHIVREAAELIVAEEALRQLLHGDPAGGPVLQSYFVRLARAKGQTEFFAQIPPRQGAGMGRGLTLAIKSYNGAYRAAVLPNLLAKDLALAYLDRADGGLFDREGVWGNPHYIGAIHPYALPDGPNAWWDAHPAKGLAARAAWAAQILEDLRETPKRLREAGLESVEYDVAEQLRNNLFKVERSLPDGRKDVFAREGEANSRCWTIAQLDRVLATASRAEIPRAPSKNIPIEFFRYRASSNSATAR